MRAFAILAAMTTLAAASSARSADSVADFYKKTTVTLQIGSGPAGGYDTVGRLVARNISRYIPGNPTIVVQNVPGGGSLQLANQFANTTKNDGSVFGVMNSGMATTPLLDPRAVHFDTRKFGFLGSPSGEVEVLVAWRDANVTKPEDVFARPMIIGASSPGSATYDIPYLMNSLLGAKFKIVTGYPSSNDIKLALERGEVQGDGSLGLSSLLTEYADVYKSGKLIIVAQYGFERAKELPNTPLFPIGDVEANRKMFAIAYARSSYGQPFVTPPGVPQERVAALRTAFEKTMRDPDFLAQAEAAHFEIDPISGQYLTDLTEKLFATPPDILARLQDLIAHEGK